MFWISLPIQDSFLYKSFSLRTLPSRRKSEFIQVVKYFCIRFTWWDCHCVFSFITSIWRFGVVYWNSHFRRLGATSISTNGTGILRESSHTVHLQSSHMGPNLEHLTMVASLRYIAFPSIFLVWTTQISLSLCRT